MQATRGSQSPADVDYVRTADRIELSWRWFRASVLFNVVWLLIWFGALSGFYFAAVVTRSPTAALIPTLHTIAGLWVAYLTAIRVFNRTTVTLDLQHIRIATGPIPVRGGNQEIPSAEITQLYVRRGGTKKKSAPDYEIHALTASYVDLKLAGGIRKLGTAHFIEAELEEFLEIQDRPVADSEHRDRPPRRQPTEPAVRHTPSTDGPFSPRPDNLR
jgi:hypothetical protein